VLEGLGWRFHRIWSTAWFRDRNNEEIRLKEALDAARFGKRTKAVATSRPQYVEVAVDEISADAAPSWITEYQSTRLRSNSSKYEFNDPRATAEIASAIKSVVTAEGPVHEDRVLRIVREQYGLGRAGTQIRESFSTALRMVLRGDYSKKDGFISVEGQKLSTVRSPNPKVASTLRSIDEIPSEEIDLAVVNLLQDAMNATADELIVRISRLFGWARTGTEISAAVERSINRLKRSGQLIKAGSQLSIKQ
jgi:hypothetical protein